MPHAFVEEDLRWCTCVHVVNMLCGGGERASDSRVGRSGCFIGCCPPCDGLSCLGEAWPARRSGWVVAACSLR